MRMIPLKQALLMPLKGTLRNIWLVILATISVTLFTASVFVGDVLDFIGAGLESWLMILIRAVLIFLSLLLPIYIVGVLHRTCEQEEFKIQSKGFFNSFARGIKLLLVFVPYYALFFGSLFFHGEVAYWFTVIYLIVCVLVLPAILLVSSKKLVNGWNPIALGRKVFTIQYLVSTIVGAVVLTLYYFILRGLHIGLFYLIDGTQADLIQYIIYNSVTYMLTGVVALFALYSYVGLYFSEDTAENTDVKSKSESKRKKSK